MRSSPRKLRVLVLGFGAALAGLTLPMTARAAAQQTPVSQFGTAVPGQLTSPVGATVDSEGNVWVADSNGNQVDKYDYNGNFIAAFTGTSAGPFEGIEGIGSDDDGSIYISDELNDQVDQITTAGALVRRLGTPGDIGPGQLNLPNGVAVDSAGVIYVADEGNSRVVRFAPDGTPLPPIGTGRLDSPSSLAVVGDHLYVADRGLGYVVEFRTSGMFTSGQFVRNIGVPGTTGGFTTFMNPTGAPGGITIEPSGLVDVVDTRAAMVRRFTQTGTFVDALGTPGSNPLQLYSPYGLASDCRGSLYVVDTGVTKVVKYAYAGAPPPPCTLPHAPAGGVNGQVNEIEVTQGTQPVITTTAGDGPGGRTRAYGVGTGEVPLVAGRKTIARVYADLVSGPSGGLANVPMTLVGYADGRQLGSIEADQLPSILRVGNTTVGFAQRTDPAGAYTFTLPEAWTEQNSLTLVATLNPSGIGCDGICQLRSTFTLTGVHFNVISQHETVVPVALTINGAYPALSDGTSLQGSPLPAFSAALTVIPRNLTVDGWAGAAEVGYLDSAKEVIAQTCVLGINLGILCRTRHYYPPSADYRALLEARLFFRLKSFAGIDGPWAPVMGLIGQGNGQLPGATPNVTRFVYNPLYAFGVMYATSVRPLTAVAHELNHAYGRLHASGCNGGGAGGQIAESWPPDQQGYLQGIGIDTRPGSGGSTGPYRIIAAGAPGNPAQVYDFMSYCASTADTDSWISPKGWNEVLNWQTSGITVTPSARRLAGDAADRAAATDASAARRSSSAAGSSARRAAARHEKVLTVSGVELPSGTLVLTSSQPTIGAPTQANPSSPYRLEARTRGGKILASTPVLAVAGAEDAGKLITGSVADPPGTGELVLRRGTQTATRLVRPRHAPTVRLRSPQRGALSDTMIPIRWRASDADHDHLNATVAYSANGGRTYTEVWSGPSTGHAELQASFLRPSRRGRLKVVVDDGFNETQSVSGPLVVPGAAPVTLITAPNVRERLRAGAPLSLSGSATGDGGRPLPAGALSWFDGSRLLGHGPNLSINGLAAGRHRVRLVAHEGAHVGQASVSVVIHSTRPEFLQLHAPSLLGPHARRLTLHVAATEPATLRIGRQRVSVTSTPRAVSVTVTPGHTLLRLTLKLTAGGQSTATMLQIQRQS